jgi:cell division protein FtsI (penicillin-binding protein 3)
LPSEQNNPEHESRLRFPSSEKRKRLMWISLFIFGLFSLLIIQFYRIQIVEGEKWTKAARAQHQILLKEPFKRGVFYANSDIKQGHHNRPQPFVVDIPKFHLYIDPLSIPEATRDTIAKKLAVALQLHGSDILKLRAQFEKKSRSRKLVMWVNNEMHKKIQKWWGPFAKENKIARNALYFVQDYRRSYPFGKMLGQVLHTLREDKDERTGQNIPTGGLEMIFNPYLKGKMGKRLLLRSPSHPLDTGKILSHPQHGADIYLTVNHTIQAIMEEEIAKAVQFANAQSGWAIMMDPHSGDVLGLAQYPFFDPSKYRDYFNDPKKLEMTKVKAVTDPFEPGSTMKPITLAICLKANKELEKRGKKPIVFPQEKVATSSGAVPGRSRPIRDTHSHAYLNLDLAMQKSSNIYMARMIGRVINSLGEAWYRKALQEIFGFGVKTGIELPSESIGLLPTPGKKHPNGALEWSTPTPYSLAMGHNILVNSLQMMRAYAILANGGFDVKPTFVRKIVKSNKEGECEVLLDNTKHELARKRVLEPEIVEQIVSAMKLVTKPGGTASKADIPGYTEAGKTGTTEKIVNGTYAKDHHISTFIGFTPVKEARFILMIVIDEPEKKIIPGVGKMQMGGNCAAPAFREIALRTLQYLGVEPDDPYGYPPGDPRRNDDKADCMQRIAQLKKLYQEWNH